MFALGAERSTGTAAHLDTLAQVEPELWVRRLDAEILEPVSDYEPFWRRSVPFVFLTCARWRHYHTPNDTPDKLDYAKMAALARWLERWTRESCARPEPRVTFHNQRDDASTARTLISLTRSLEPLSAQAGQARQFAEALLARCDARGQLPAAACDEARNLVAMLEASFQ